MEGGDFWKAPGVLGVILCGVIVIDGYLLLAKLFQHLQSLSQESSQESSQKSSQEESLQECERRQQQIQNLRKASDWLNSHIIEATLVARKLNEGSKPLDVLKDLELALKELKGYTASNGLVNNRTEFERSLHKLRESLDEASGRRVIEELCKEQRDSRSIPVFSWRGGITYISLRCLVFDLCKFYTNDAPRLAKIFR